MVIANMKDFFELLTMDCVIAMMKFRLDRIDVSKKEWTKEYEKGGIFVQKITPLWIEDMNEWVALSEQGKTVRFRKWKNDITFALDEINKFYADTEHLYLKAVNSHQK